MNKYKKIAAAVVSIVLAGTMIGSLAACNSGGSASGGKLEVKTDEDGNLTYAANTTINFNVGNRNTTVAQGISYQSGDISGSTYLVDGKSYSAGNLKPAWAAMASQLKINAVDRYQNATSDNQISQPIEDHNLANYDIISGSLSIINENTSSFVNLADWLDYMPNYKSFLEEYPVTKYSLTGDANGGMYAAPYFDGNDDIEYYHTIRKDWVEKILDTASFNSSKFTTYAAQAKSKDSYKDANDATQYYGSIDGTKTSVKGYMGSVEKDNYVVETVNPDGGANIYVKLNYKAALDAANDEGSELYAALKAAWDEYDGSESGNVVDLQNIVIDGAKGEVTGDKLAKIVQEYIKVAYQKAATANATEWTQMYGVGDVKLSDVFNSVAAAWDVDLMVATLRPIVCGTTANGGMLDNEKGDIWGIVSRQGTSQRRKLIIEMVGELYGVRGLGSRLEFLYFDAEGNLQDARQDTESFEVLNNFSKLAKEGLFYTGDKGGDGWNSWRNDEGILGAMSYDYVQTQTRRAIQEIPQKVAFDYNYAPILTPVSRWDEDSNKDNGHETVMRFTESWRTVKNTGFCIPIDSVKGKPDKFSAVLSFIDFLFSEDGQILMTYGTPSDTDSYDPATGTASDNGWWYAEESDLALETVADVKVEGYGNIPTQYTVKDEYKTGDNGVFVYNGKVYKGIEYGGRMVPKITDANYALFAGETITVKNANGETLGTVAQKSSNFLVNQAANYTNYARYTLGTTLPIGNKNQGFEYQCTAECGKDGAQIVDQAIKAGVIKHVGLDPETVESAWYFISPAVYPHSSTGQTALKNTTQTQIGTYFQDSSDSDKRLNVYIDVMFYGVGTKTFLGQNIYILGQTANGSLKDSAEDYVTWLNNQGMTNRIAIYRQAWNTLVTTYDIEF